LSKTFTKKEIESEVGAALAAPAPADSAAKAKFKFAESRRKKNEEKRKNFKELLYYLNGTTGGLSMKSLPTVRLCH